MPHAPHPFPLSWQRPLRAALLAAGTVWLTGCAPPLPSPLPSPAPQPPAASPGGPGAPGSATGPEQGGAPRAPGSTAPTAAAERQPPRPSNAANPRDYRKDAAGHLYALNAERIYKGMLQPNLYAVGVLQVDVDRAGRVMALRWMRAPQHAPEVVKEIERTVREAAPFPQPTRLGRVTYTDTWLWDKSGRFQLDTLTEGQL